MKTKSKKIVIASLTIAVLAVVTIVFFMMSGSGTTVYAEHLELSQKYLDELEYDLAIAELEKAIELEPKKVETYVYLADIYVRKGDYDAANKVMEDASKAIPEAEDPEQFAIVEKTKAEIIYAEEMFATDLRLNEIGIETLKEAISEAGTERGTNEKKTVNDNVTNQAQGDKKNDSEKGNHSTNSGTEAEKKESGDSALENSGITQTQGTRTERVENKERGLYYIDEYDAKDRLVKRTCFNDADVFQWASTNEYDEVGRQTQITMCGEDGFVMSRYVYSYDENGKIISEIQYDSDGSYWVYEDGSAATATKATYYTADGEMLAYNIIEYDANGNRSKLTMYNKNGEVTDTYTYDNGYSSQTSNTATNSGVTSKKNQEKVDAEDGGYYMITYDNNGNISEKVLYDSNDVIQETYYYEYNGQGLVISESQYSGNMEMRFYITYEYDWDGKLTRKMISNLKDNSYSTWNYNPDGTIAYGNEQDGDGSMVEYTDGGPDNATYIYYYSADGTSIEYEERHYDQNGKLVYSARYNENGELVGENTY